MNKPTIPLLPCPFCVAAPHTETVNYLDEDGSATHIVGCNNPVCQVSAAAFSDLSIEHAAAKWNTRKGAV